MFTDGSGHVDGFGGWCCRVICDELNLDKTIYGAASGSSVEKMEMQAYLAGLQGCYEMVLEMKPEEPPVIFWYSDRESMVKIMLGDYKPSASQDLWHLVQYYLRFVKVVPHHLPRENEEMAWCDMHASTLRMVIKNYTQQTES